MIKILVGDNSNVDFDAAIKMDDKQKTRFIEFMKDNFKVVEIEEVDEVRTERIGDKIFQREWSAEEYATLLEIEDNDTVTDMLGRSWMSINIKRGDFIPKFLAWADEKKYDLLKGNFKNYIKEFMKEKQDEIMKNRRKRSKVREINKKIKELFVVIDSYDDDLKRQQIDFMIRMKQASFNSVDEYIKDKRKKLKEEIKELKEELDDLE